MDLAETMPCRMHLHCLSTFERADANAGRTGTSGARHLEGTRLIMAAANVLSIILFLGLAFKACGFLVRDELALRVLVLVGMSCDILFYAFQPVPIWQSLVTNGLLVSINLALVLIIVFERTTFSMTARERALYDHFPTLKPGQFRRLLRHAIWRRAEGETQLAEEGGRLDKLYFLQVPQFDIEKQGRRFTAPGPSFAGELVFLGGGQSSASVWVPPGSDYVEFDSAALRRAMDRSSALSNGMVALFGADLARKVANSVPIRETERHAAAPHLQGAQCLDP